MPKNKALCACRCLKLMDAFTEVMLVWMPHGKYESGQCTGYPDQAVA